MAVQLVDFQDIYESVLEELKIPSTDTTALARVKRNINAVYVNEVAPFKNWPWLRKRKDIVHAQYYNTGTLNITNGSTSVTASATIAASKANYFLSVEGYEEIFVISAHTAGSASITLSSAFTGTTNTAASYKIWTDRVNLPTDARETVSIHHDFKSYPMKGRGAQKLDELMRVDPKLEDRPEYYSTDDYFDPSSGDAETETDRYRQVRVYPSIYNEDTTLHVTYIQEVDELDADGDEPVMPIEDRIVLVYGALKSSWARERNPEMSADNERKFKEKLALMAGRYEDSTDHPTLTVDDFYMRSRRRSWYSGN